MSLKTVFQLKNSVAGLLSGLDLSNVDNLNGALERAARTMLQKADVPEASGIQNVTLYSGVFDYACDPRIFGTAINDIRPQGITRNPSNFAIKTDQESFDRTKAFYYPSGTMSTFQYSNGQPIIRIKAPFPKQQLILSPMNALDNWVAGGTATNLAVDSTVFYASPASLRFTNTAGVGNITTTLDNQLDLSTYQGVGVSFLATMIPQGATAADLTSIELQLGSDDTNYSSVTATQGFLGAWVSGEWLLVAFDFATATTTGSPDWTNIDFISVITTTASTITNLRIGGLWMSFPTPAQILYQSAAIFLPVGSTTPTTIITADTDSITLSDPAYTIYEIESAIAVCQQTGGTTGSAMVSTFESMLNGARARNGQIIVMGLYDLYQGDNPSQELRTVASWYDNSNGYDDRN